MSNLTPNLCGHPSKLRIQLFHLALRKLEEASVQGRTTDAATDKIIKTRINNALYVSLNRFNYWFFLPTWIEVAPL